MFNCANIGIPKGYFVTSALLQDIPPPHRRYFSIVQKCEQFPWRLVLNQMISLLLQKNSRCHGPFEAVEDSLGVHVGDLIDPAKKMLA